KLYPEVFVDQIKLPNLGKGYISMLMFFAAAKAWIKENGMKFDIFHGLSAFEYTFRPALWFQSLGKPAFIKLTSLHGGFGNSSLLSTILGISQARRKNSVKLSGYLAVSSAIFKNLSATGIPESKIYRIPNGVDVQRFYPLENQTMKEALRLKLGLRDLFTVCYLGGLTENKRVLEIVISIHELLKIGCKMQLLVVGPDRSGGHVEKLISNYVNANKLSNNIVRVDHTTKPQVYLQCSDLYILNSVQEGMPNSLLEAMACGLPSISTRVSG